MDIKKTSEKFEKICDIKTGDTFLLGPHGHLFMKIESGECVNLENGISFILNPCTRVKVADVKITLNGLVPVSTVRAGDCFAERNGQVWMRVESSKSIPAAVHINTGKVCEFVRDTPVKVVSASVEE